MGHERIDSHISDDHNDPPRAALEDIDPDQKNNQADMGRRLFLGLHFPTFSRVHSPRGLPYSVIHNN